MKKITISDLKDIKQSFIALVKDDYISQIDTIAEQLKLKDCEITQILKLTGVITGKTTKKLNTLQIEGISSIEKEHIITKNILT